MLNSKFYDVLKSVAQIWLPALGTLMFTVGEIWHLSWTSAAVGTIMAVDTFLGAGLGLSTRQYNKSDTKYDGNLVVDTSHPLKDTFSIDITNMPLADLPDHKEVLLRIVPAEDVHHAA